MFWLVGPVAGAYAQEEYPSVACAASQQLKAVFQYDVDATPGVAQPRRQPIGADFYDRAGHHTQWQQYDWQDSTRFSTRSFTYDGQGHVTKMADLSPDKSGGIIDSSRLDERGYVSYRRLYRPSGEVLLEAFVSTALNQRQRPVKSEVFDNQQQLQGYTLFTYNPEDKVVLEAEFTAEKVLAQQRTHQYYPGGTLRKTTEIKGRQDTLLVKAFTPMGLLVEETHFNQELPGGPIDYKIVRTYDRQQREVEAVTYSRDFGPGNKLVASRREVSQYGASCLKHKTLIYTRAPFTKEEKLQVVFAYRYTYYP
jgi:antitoxin component YwqK of YwqJK toxin-antitoxin module